MREILVKINFFGEQSGNAMNPKASLSGPDVCSEEGLKMVWMRETRIRTFIQMKLKTYRDELD